MVHVDKIREHYQEKLVNRKENARILDWESSEAQELRFRALLDNVDLQNSSLLDVGSGLGDLWKYIRSRSIQLDYTGVDILPEMVQRACGEHPDAKFHCVDIFSDRDFLEHCFDVVYCSGVFNLNLGNNREFFERAMEIFFRVAKEYVVFNLLHKRSPSPEDRYYYTDPEETIEIVSPYCEEYQIVDDYLPNDYTVICKIRKACK